MLFQFNLKKIFLAWDIGNPETDDIKGREQRILCG